MMILMVRGLRVRVRDDDFEGAGLPGAALHGTGMPAPGLPGAELSPSKRVECNNRLKKKPKRKRASESRK